MKTQGLFGVLSLPSPLHTCSTALVGVALFCLATSARADLSNFQRLYSFGNAELSGSFPDRVIECSDGRLYGTAAHETSEFEGIIYRINKDGSGYAVLHRFKETAPTGDRPSDGLLEASDGSLYGTTTEGGANGKGTLFRIKKDGTGLSVVYAFRGPTNGDVQEANGRLIEGSDGALLWHQLAGRNTKCWRRVSSAEGWNSISDAEAVRQHGRWRVPCGRIT